MWSLAIEEQFYIFWPLILVFFTKRKVKFQWGILGSLLMSFLFCVFLVKKDPTAAFYSPVSRFWEILIGALLASSDHLVAKFKGFKKLASYVGVPLLITGFVLLDKSKLFPGYWALLPTVGACLIIFSGSDNWINKRILSHPLLVWIGLISYPLYLWHWPLISMANIISLEPPSVALRVVLVLSSFVLAWLTLK
ncbi:MAG: acyltransferase family protein, partial [Bdellovibrio sp.]